MPDTDLARFFTNMDGSVYALKNLPEEVVAYLFARYSRSRLSLRDDLRNMMDAEDLGALIGPGGVDDQIDAVSALQERARAFAEKYVLGYGHSCYDDQTEVLTEDGWKSWAELAREWQAGTVSRLATLNPETNSLEYLLPERVIAESYQGRMYCVRGKYVDLCVTPNHRMWVCPTTTKQGRLKQDYRLIPADQLEGVSCAYQLTARWKGPEPENFVIGGHSINSKAFMKFVGFFVGDGHHDRRYHSYVQFHLRKQREIQYLEAVATECGFEVRQHGRKHGIISPCLGDVMRTFYDDQKQKSIPRKWLEFGPGLLACLWDGLMHSDGSFGTNDLVYASEPLRDQIYEIALKIGHSAYAVGHVKGNRPCYAIHINRTNPKPVVNKLNTIKQDGWIAYDGMVYCAKMPANHILFVRRNGRAVWSGNSVAEHGVVHLALEDVSIIASKLIEDARLASYTEKSTRYVAFDPGKAYFPPRVMADSHLGAEYRRAVRGLLTAYTGWTEDFVAQIQARTPRSEKHERAYEAASRATAFDLLRYLLPTATHTNVGLTLNARALEHLITKLLSQPLEEGRELGAQMKVEARHVVPTLLKYADYNTYRAETSEAIEALATELLGDLTPPRSSATLSLVRRGWEPERAGEVSPVSLVFSDPDAENRLVAAILYGASHLPMETLLARVNALDPADKERVVDGYLKRRGKHDAPGRALERLFCTVEMTMDYGAYRDVQRHRMATQTTQALSPALGFERPAEFETFGYAEQYDDLMAQSAETYGRLCEAGFAHEAAYVLPLATRIRVLFTWNLREVTHFVELRSARQGHPSYRKIAQDVYHAVAQSYPLIARYMRPNLNTYALTRE